MRYNKKNYAKIILIIFVIMCSSLICVAKSNAAVWLSARSITLAPKEKCKLYLYGTSKKCKWSSTNKKVATVSKTGRITAKKAGKATIKAKYGKKTKKCNVVVKNAAITDDNSYYEYTIKFNNSTKKSKSIATNDTDDRQVSLEKTEVALVAGESTYISLSNSEYNDDIECISSNESVATASGSYRGINVKCISEGTAVITVTVNKSRTLTCQVRVARKFEANTQSIEVPYHTKAQIDINVPFDEVSLSSQDETIATVDSNGMVYGVYVGSTRIDVKYMGNEYRIYVKVILSPSDFSYKAKQVIHVGQTGHMNFVCTNEDIINNFSATIECDSNGVCDIDSYGNIYAKKLGKSFVRINIGTVASFICDVEVYEFQIPEEDTVYRIGDTDIIECKWMSVDEYTVTSSDENVVKVSPWYSEDYKLEAVASGKAVLTFTCGDYSVERKVSVAKGVVDAIKSNDYLGYNDDEKHTLQTVRAVIDNNTSPGMSTAQKVKAIHDYLVLNCDYDYSILQNGRVPNEPYSYVGVFRNRKAVCNGYAMAFALCMKVLDIPCKKVVGSANNNSHAWNQVLIDGTWYYIDVTWDDPIINGGIDSGYIRWNYYLSVPLWSDHEFGSSYEITDFDSYLRFD